MKYGNLFNVPLGVPITGAPKKHIAAALAGMVGGYLSGAVQSSMQADYTAQNMKLQSRLNREEMQHSMQLQRAQQEWLMNRQYQAAVSGMKNAGLNPATANGVSPAVPSGGTPHSGSSGPAAGMPNIDLVRSAKELELMEAQKKNIDADTDSKRSASKNIDADTRLKEIQGSPEWVKAGLDKLQGDAKLAWMNVNATDQQITESMARVQQIGKNMQLTDEQINNLQVLSAKYTQDIRESISRVGLNKVEAYFKLTSASLNRALETQAYTNAAEARERINSGLYRSQAAANYAGANEANERVNSGLYRSQAAANYAGANESEANVALLRKKGFTEDQIRQCKEIEKQLLQFDNEVNQNYGSMTKAGIQYGTDLLGLLSGGLLGRSAPITGRLR